MVSISTAQPKLSLKCGSLMQNMKKKTCQPKSSALGLKSGHKHSSESDHVALVVHFGPVKSCSILHQFRWRRKIQKIVAASVDTACILSCYSHQPNMRCQDGIPILVSHPGIFWLTSLVTDSAAAARQWARSGTLMITYRAKAVIAGKQLGSPLSD